MKHVRIHSSDGGSMDDVCPQLTYNDDVHWLPTLRMCIGLTTLRMCIGVVHRLCALMSYHEGVH